MAAVTAAGLLAGCGSSGSDEGSGTTESTEEGKIIIFTDDIPEHHSLFFLCLNSI